MALVVICGYPSSVKSCFSNKLKSYLSKIDDKNVEIINDENYLIDKNDVYKNLRKEIQFRQTLKSAVKTNLNDKNIIIVDSANYIKSFRYELFCLAKSLCLKYCVIYCCMSKDNVSSINDSREVEKRYDNNILQELIDRFEEPSYTNRWDMPLFIVDPRKDDLDFKEICDTIILKNKTLKPNIATQNQALPHNYLQEVDQMTQDIVKKILNAQQKGESSVSFNNSDLELKLIKKYSIIELYKYRRSFINRMSNNFSSKIQESSSNLLNNAREIFIQFLNEQLQ